MVDGPSCAQTIKASDESAEKWKRQSTLNMRHETSSVTERNISSRHNLGLRGSEHAVAVCSEQRDAPDHRFVGFQEAERMMPAPPFQVQCAILCSAAPANGRRELFAASTFRDQTTGDAV
jgi:hypothetical protein